MKVKISLELNTVDSQIMDILKRSPYPLTVEQIRKQLARKEIKHTSMEISKDLNILAMYFVVQKTKGSRVCSYSLPEDTGIE